MRSKRRPCAADAGGPTSIDNDWVLAMTGYSPDYLFLERLAIGFADDPFRTPIYDVSTFETTRPGLFIAGTVCGGYQTSRWFIENGRFHARKIMGTSPARAPRNRVPDGALEDRRVAGCRS